MDSQLFDPSANRVRCVGVMTVKPAVTETAFQTTESHFCSNWQNEDLIHQSTQTEGPVLVDSAFQTLESTLCPNWHQIQESLSNQKIEAVSKTAQFDPISHHEASAGRLTEKSVSTAPSFNTNSFGFRFQLEKGINGLAAPFSFAEAKQYAVFEKQDPRSLESLHRETTNFSTPPPVLHPVSPFSVSPATPSTSNSMGNNEELSNGVNAADLLAMSLSMPSETPKKRQTKTFVEFSAIKDYILTGRYPAGYRKDQKRTLRKKAVDFSVGQDYVLYYKSSKIVVETEEQKRDVFRAAHECRDESGTFSHNGENRTCQNIIPYYYWHSIVRDTKKYVAECAFCATQKQPNSSRKRVADKLTDPHPALDPSLAKLLKCELHSPQSGYFMNDFDGSESSFSQAAIPGSAAIIGPQIFGTKIELQDSEPAQNGHEISTGITVDY